MKFELKTTIEILDYQILELVNDFQFQHDVEEFTSLEEIPIELIFMALDDTGEFQYQLDCLSIEDYDIIKIDETN